MYFSQKISLGIPSLLNIPPAEMVNQGTQNMIRRGILFFFKALSGTRPNTTFVASSLMSYVPIAVTHGYVDELVSCISTFSHERKFGRTHPLGPPQAWHVTASLSRRSEPSIAGVSRWSEPNMAGEATAVALRHGYKKEYMLSMSDSMVDPQP